MGYRSSNPLIIQSHLNAQVEDKENSKRLNRFDDLDAGDILEFVKVLLGDFKVEETRRVLDCLKDYHNLDTLVLGVEEVGEDEDQLDIHQTWGSKRASREDVLGVWRRRRRVLGILGIEVIDGWVGKGGSSAVVDEGADEEFISRNGVRNRSHSGRGTKVGQGRGLDLTISKGSTEIAEPGKGQHEQVVMLKVGRLIMDVMDEENRYGYSRNSIELDQELQYWIHLKKSLIPRLWRNLQGYLERIEVLKSDSEEGIARPTDIESWSISLLARESLLPLRLSSAVKPILLEELDVRFDIRDSVEYIRLLCGFHTGVDQQTLDEHISNWYEYNPRLPKDLAASIIRIRNGLYTAKRFDDILRMVKLLSPVPSENTDQPHQHHHSYSISSRTSQTPLTSRNTISTSHPTVALRSNPFRMDLLQNLYSSSPKTTISSLLSRLERPSRGVQAQSGYHNRNSPSLATTQVYPNTKQIFTLPPPALHGSVISHLITTPRNASQIAKILPLLASMKLPKSHTVLVDSTRRMLRYLANRANGVVEIRLESTAQSRSNPFELAVRPKKLSGKSTGEGEVRRRDIADENISSFIQSNTAVRKEGFRGSYKQLLEWCFDRWGVGFSESVWRKLKQLDRPYSTEMGHSEIEDGEEVDMVKDGTIAGLQDDEILDPLDQPEDTRGTPNSTSVSAFRSSDKSLAQSIANPIELTISQGDPQTQVEWELDAKVNEHMWKIQDLRRRDEAERLRSFYKMKNKTPQNLSQGSRARLSNSKQGRIL